MPRLAASAIACVLASLSCCAGAWAATGTDAATTELGELPHPDSHPSAIVSGPDGNLWFTELGATVGGDDVGRIGQISPDGQLAEFALPTSGAQPTGIAAGPDGNLWFTESGVDQIGRITPTGQITEFGGLTAGGDPTDIAAGPDGRLWFTEGGYNRGNRIGAIDPATGAVREYCIRGCDRPSDYVDAGLHPTDIVAGPDGKLWFTEANPDRGDGASDPYGDQGTGYVGSIATDGTVKEYAVPTFNAQPSGIAVGPDGNVWFDERSGVANRVGEVTPSGTVTELGDLPTPDARPGRMVSTGDGDLWIAEEAADRLAVVDAGGQPYELPPLPTADAEPAGLALGDDGNLWLTEFRGNKLARVALGLAKKEKDEAAASGSTASSAPAPAGGATPPAAAAPTRPVSLTALVRAVASRLRGPSLARLVRRGGLTLALDVPAVGKLTILLVGPRHVVLARATTAIDVRGPSLVHLALVEAGRRALRAHRRLPAAVSAELAMPSGRLSASRRLRLRLR